MSRNLESRIVKLEIKTTRTDEMLLVWRRPDGDVADALKGATFSHGDKVICAEWFGDGPLPAPKWCRERLSSELGIVENGYLTRSLARIAEGPHRDPGFAEVPAVSANRVRELADNDLLHMVFGVAT